MSQALEAALSDIKTKAENCRTRAARYEAQANELQQLINSKKG